jgi:adenylylsulfate kinase
MLNEYLYPTIQKSPKPVIWLCGMPGCGKTTISQAIKKEFDKNNIASCLLDGDVLRQGINADLKFSMGDRFQANARAAYVAKCVSDSGIIPIVAMVSPFQVLRYNSRKILHPARCFLVLVDCSQSTRIERDPKGLYKKHAEEIIGYPDPNNIHYCSMEYPHDADLILNTDDLSLDECKSALLKKLAEEKLILDITKNL